MNGRASAELSGRQILLLRPRRHILWGTSRHPIRLGKLSNYISFTLLPADVRCGIDVGPTTWYVDPTLALRWCARSQLSWERFQRTLLLSYSNHYTAENRWALYVGLMSQTVGQHQIHIDWGKRGYSDALPAPSAQRPSLSWRSCPQVGTVADGWGHIFPVGGASCWRVSALAAQDRIWPRGSHLINRIRVSGIAFLRCVNIN